MLHSVTRTRYEFLLEHFARQLKFVVSHDSAPRVVQQVRWNSAA